ncbi:MAG: hypothetical protein KTR16_14350 [Acidiferrobacterales bacterium]|nr:hypothetical protein [Acidiferrobacterales bacterium]
MERLEDLSDYPIQKSMDAGISRSPGGDGATGGSIRLLHTKSMNAGMSRWQDLIYRSWINEFIEEESMVARNQLFCPSPGCYVKNLEKYLSMIRIY